MEERATIGSLLSTHEITVEDVQRAIDTYLAVPTTTSFSLAQGYELNLAEAVRARPMAYNSFLNPAVRWSHKREAVRSALLLAYPLKRPSEAPES